MKFSLEERQKLQERCYTLYKTGMGFIAIAKELGVSRQTIYDWTEGFRPLKTKCAYCGNVFTKTSTNRIYCTHRCNDNAYYRRKKERDRVSA